VLYIQGPSEEFGGRGSRGWDADDEFRKGESFAARAWTEESAQRAWNVAALKPSNKSKLDVVAQRKRLMAGGARKV